MKAWTLFLPQVLPEVKGCPDVLAVNAIRNAAIEFCEKSSIWRYEFTSKFSLVADKATYDLLDLADMPAGAEVIAVPWLGFKAPNTSKFYPVRGPRSIEWLDRNVPTWREDRASGVNHVEHFTLDDSVIRVIPIPAEDQADALWPAAALKPDLLSIEGPDILYTDFLEFIASGAKARLMSMRDEPWSNETLAGHHFREFRRGINRATAKRIKGGGAESATAYPRSFV
ncbi:MAG TPA: hypothetical protein VF193_14170 [Steroidobacter sp.]